MTYQAIRALFEVELNNQFAAVGVPVVFDNVQETPPANANQMWAQITLSFTQATVPVLCPEESCAEEIRGTVSVNVWGMRANGMGPLELLGSQTIGTLNRIKRAAINDPNILSAFVGSIEGPQPLLDDEEPWAGVVVTAPFIARV